MKKILLIDLDNVIANFEKAYISELKTTPEILYPQCKYKFFENLEPIEDSIETINILNNLFELYILTRPSVLNPLCYTEKRVWVEKYLGLEMCKKLILCSDKTMVMGDYLIDDKIQTGIFEPIWKHIHFGSAEFSNWKKIKNYLLKND